jgi:ribonuclease G
LERELVIRSTQQGAEIALLEDKLLVELHHEYEDSQFNVGDIFLGSVKRVNLGLNAAFLDVGFSRDAFLHYTDLSPNIRSLLKFTRMCINGQMNQPLLDDFKYEQPIVKTGKINNALSKKFPVLVQILKEPISTKGPRLTCEISLAGRFLIMQPFGKTVGISRKIGSEEERKRLVRLIESIKPKNFSVVIRTVAEGKGVAELHADLSGLVEKWKTIAAKLKGLQAPAKVIGEVDKTSGLLRDLLNESFTKINITDKEVYEDVKGYIQRIAPAKAGIVQLYTHRIPAFDALGVTRQIKSLFGKNVTLESGAYLVLEHTEALHVIDVNSGQRTNQSDQESNAVGVNMEAVKEIARQLRLRDIGGIIIIDFIDMKNPANKRKVYEAMREAMSVDRAKHTILGISRFGLMQITRQRVRPELHIATAEVCPSCNGTGTIGPSLLLTDEMERKVEYLVKNQNMKLIQLHVHPYLYAYLRSGRPSLRKQWARKYKAKIRLTSNTDFHLMEFRFHNAEGEEIELT